MFEAMLKSMGFDPIEFKTKFIRAMELVDTFDQRLKDIDAKLDVIYTAKKLNEISETAQSTSLETEKYMGGPLA